MASITIRQAIVADAANIAAINLAAYGPTNTIYAAFFKNNLEEIVPVAVAAAINRGEKFNVAVDDGNQRLVGYCRWVIDQGEGDLDKKDAAEDDSIKEEKKMAPDDSGGIDLPPSIMQLYAPKDHLKELYEKMESDGPAMDECHEKAAAGRKHYYIKQLFIHPDYQRKGIGRRMLSQVLQKSDREKLPTFLQSSESSHHLYSSLGFEDLGSWKKDTAYFAREVRRLNDELGYETAPNLEKDCGDGEDEAIMVRWGTSRD